MTMSQTANPSVDRASNASPSVSDPHALPADNVLSTLESRRDGLSAAEAAERLKAVGPNRLPAPPKEGLFKRFFKHFNDILIYILLFAGVAKAVLGHWVDACVILAVAVINAIVGFLQEGNAEEALEGIRKMLSLRAHTRREAEWVELDAAELVPGDIVRLRSGDRVPADVRLIEAVNLRIEESALTALRTGADAAPTTPAGNADSGGICPLANRLRLAANRWHDRRCLSVRRAAGLFKRNGANHGGEHPGTRPTVLLVQ